MIDNFISLVIFLDLLMENSFSTEIKNGAIVWRNCRKYFYSQIFNKFEYFKNVLCVYMYYIHISSPKTIKLLKYLISINQNSNYFSLLAASKRFKLLPVGKYIILRITSDPKNKQIEIKKPQWTVVIIYMIPATTNST